MANEKGMIKPQGGDKLLQKTLYGIKNIFRSKFY